MGNRQDLPLLVTKLPSLSSDLIGLPAVDFFGVAGIGLPFAVGLTPFAAEADFGARALPIEKCPPLPDFLWESRILTRRSLIALGVGFGSAIWDVSWLRKNSIRCGAYSTHPLLGSHST